MRVVETVEARLIGGSELKNENSVWTRRNRTGVHAGNDCVVIKVAKSRSCQQRYNLSSRCLIVGQVCGDSWLK